MSTPVMSLVNDAAHAIGDPNKQRVEIEQWVSIFNRSQRELCERTNILKYQDTFDLVSGQTRYDYPDSMIVMTGLEVSETPSDETTFRVLDEIFEDEFRALTSASYPSASLPSVYFSTAAWFNLVPAVTEDIDEGGVITYASLPSEYTFNQVVNGNIEVPDFARDYLTQRMIIHGMESRHRIEEARNLLTTWIADMETVQDKLDDRSQDRRSSLAPRKNRYAGMR